MIHPTRTNLLMLKEKSRSIVNSIGILKARKQALIKEFLAATLPFLRSREEIKKSYGRAIRELAISLGREGKDTIESLAVATERDFGIEVKEKSIWGLRYKDIAYHDTPVRQPGERGYDESGTTPHLDDSVNLFEKLLESMLTIAEYESKLKRLGDEIVKTTRRIKVLEEMVLPGIKRQIRSIGQYIGEREREAFYRLKRVKSILERKAELVKVRG
ncbi:MAG: V-type ATPase, subunit [Nitrospirae bacterium]|jgi:V/A-type H+/Na+-transporting ATPase subunit D|nr:V-type ATPase, subunit [Nitrospirota bacterium]